MSRKRFTAEAMRDIMIFLLKSLTNKFCTESKNAFWTVQQSGGDIQEIQKEKPEVKIYDEVLCTYVLRIEEREIFFLPVIIRELTYIAVKLKGKWVFFYVSEDGHTFQVKIHEYILSEITKE